MVKHKLISIKSKHSITHNSFTVLLFIAIPAFFSETIFSMLPAVINGSYLNIAVITAQVNFPCSSLIPSSFIHSFIVYFTAFASDDSNALDNWFIEKVLKFNGAEKEEARTGAGHIFNHRQRVAVGLLHVFG